jgi:hypothetical protein
LGGEFDACGTEVVDLAVVNEDGDISGQVISASLTLKAGWRYLNLGADAGLPKLTAFHGLGLTFHDIKSDQEELRIPRLIACAPDRFLEPDVWTQQILSLHVICVQIGRWLDETTYFRGFVWALLLEPVDWEVDTFRRIGVATVPDHLGDPSLWPLRTFVIV